jgi:lysozyme family protein
MAASNYAACLKEILKNEGGYVNNPKDPGGETNYGVTIAVARANGYAGSMRSIPMSIVEKIYRTKYWIAAGYNGDTLAAGVDLAVFDYGVNSGPSRAAKALKASVGGSAVDTVKKICASRTSFLHGLKTWATFGKGWARRVATVEALGVKMALQGAPVAPPAIEVVRKLDTEKKAAEKARNTNATAAGGTASGGAAGTQVPSAPAPESAPVPHVDPSGFDWHVLLYVGAGVAVAALVAFFIYRTIIQHQRAKAFSAVAQGV